MVTSFASNLSPAAPPPNHSNGGASHGDGSRNLRLVTALAILAAALLVAGLIVWLATSDQFSDEIRGASRAEEGASEQRDVSADRWNDEPDDLARVPDDSGYDE
jgi:hypothetical protein